MDTWYKRARYRKDYITLYYIILYYIILYYIILCRGGGRGGCNCIGRGGKGMREG